MRRREHRTFQIRADDVDEQGQFDFYSATFGSRHRVFGTYFDKGAFARTIKHHGGKFAVCFMHDGRMPVALGAHEEDGTGLRVRGQFDLDVEPGRRVYSGVKKGYIDGGSVSFDVRQERKDEKGDWHFTEVELVESTLATRGFAADPAAVVTDVRALPGLVDRATDALEGVDGDELVEAVAELRTLVDRLEARTVNGAMDLPLAARDRKWDASAAEKRVRSWAGAEDGPNARYRRAFFWYDKEDGDQFGAYKLQFADVLGGELKAVPRGIFAVAVVLQGGRGGVDIPSGDKDAVKRRVERYYARMRKEFEDDSIVAPWESSTAEPAQQNAVGARLREITEALSPDPDPRNRTPGWRDSRSGSDADIHSLLQDMRELSRAIH